MRTEIRLRNGDRNFAATRFYFFAIAYSGSFLYFSITADTRTCSIWKFAQGLFAIRYAQFMKTVFYLIIFLLGTIISVNSQSVFGDKNVWTDKVYDFEYVEEYDKSYLRDTICLIQGFLRKDEWKIYWDPLKSKVATHIQFDSLKQIVTSKHYNKSGMLTKELQAYCKSKKNYNPAYPDIKDILFLKTYFNDSLICKIIGNKNSLLFNFSNYLTKKYFEKIVFYRDNDIIGEDTWEYYDNKALKAICNEYRVPSFDRQGNAISVCINKCTRFDKNGCILPETK